MFEHFALCNVIKYASRFPKTKNINDLKKAKHYIELLMEGQSW